MRGFFPGIHNRFTMAMGDTEEMRKAIQLLDEVKESIINGHAGFPAPAGMGCQREAEKKKPRQRFIDEVWSGVKP